MGIEAINSKFNWARHHLEFFEGQLAEYMKIDPCKFMREPNISADEKGRQWVYGTFEIAEPIPENLPLIIGDCLGNLRSCLDYLVWELVEANGKKPSDKNSFPISSTPKIYRDEISRGRLTGIDPRAADLIEKLQPYNAGDAPEHSVLFVLNKLTNTNKHKRLLLTTLKTIQPPAGFNAPDGESFRLLVNPPMTQGNARFGPYEVVDGKYKVETKVIAYIVFDEAPAQGFEVWSMLEKMADFLNTTVFPGFECFF
jgi:hypothetical protein